MTESSPSQSRRSLLRAISGHPSGDDEVASKVPGVNRTAPSAGDTVRLSTRAMACDFSVIMNPGTTEQIESAGEALNVVHAIEAWLSIYRQSSDLSRLNQLAGTEPQTVRGDLFELLTLANDLFQRTDGCFDMASGALTRLWRSARREGRIPEAREIEQILQQTGMNQVCLEPDRNRVSFGCDGIILDPGAIGKGYAIDEACSLLQSDVNGPGSFLLHGGHSSLRAFGDHNDHFGWPVGIGNPLFTEKRLGTLLLRNQALATSGSNIQFFRHEGKRYGHILNPKTGWPIEGMLSVTVLAPSAAVADALSTAFFVMGVEKAVACCENWPEIGAILIPFPEHGRKVHPIVVGISQEAIFWDESQVDSSSG